MSATDDERLRLAKKYRDLAAQELLGFFEKRDTLAPEAVDALRSELRLRGLDPDSLRATVPKATLADDEGSSGDASLVDADLPPDEPSKSVRTRRAAPESDAEGDAENDAESDADPEGEPIESLPEEPALRCVHCGTLNPAIEDLCVRCGQPLAENPQHQTIARRIAEGHAAAPRPSGTVASATTGIVGIAALVFASYSLTLPARFNGIAFLASLVGSGALIAAMLLYRAERKRKDAEASVN